MARTILLIVVICCVSCLGSAQLLSYNEYSDSGCTAKSSGIEGQAGVCTATPGTSTFHILTLEGNLLYYRQGCLAGCSFMSCGQTGNLNLYYCFSGGQNGPWTMASHSAKLVPALTILATIILATF